MRSRAACGFTELRQVAPDGTTTFAGFDHDYDAVGNRLKARNLIDDPALPYDPARPVAHAETYDYDYDDIYRLIDYRRGTTAVTRAHVAAKGLSHNLCGTGFQPVEFTGRMPVPHFWDRL